MNLNLKMNVETTGDLVELSMTWAEEGYSFMWVEDARQKEIVDLNLVGKIRIIEFMNGLYLYEEKTAEEE